MSIKHLNVQVSYFIIKHRLIKEKKYFKFFSQTNTLQRSEKCQYTLPLTGYVQVWLNTCIQVYIINMTGIWSTLINLVVVTKSLRAVVVNNLCCIKLDLPAPEMIIINVRLFFNRFCKLGWILLIISLQYYLDIDHLYEFIPPIYPKGFYHVLD